MFSRYRVSSSDFLKSSLSVRDIVPNSVSCSSMYSMFSLLKHR